MKGYGQFCPVAVAAEIPVLVGDGRIGALSNPGEDQSTDDRQRQERWVVGGPACGFTIQLDERHEPVRRPTNDCQHQRQAELPGADHRAGVAANG